MFDFEENLRNHWDWKPLGPDCHGIYKQQLILPATHMHTTHCSLSSIKTFVPLYDRTILIFSYVAMVHGLFSVCRIHVLYNLIWESPLGLTEIVTQAAAGRLWTDVWGCVAESRGLTNQAMQHFALTVETTLSTVSWHLLGKRIP